MTELSNPPARPTVQDIQEMIKLFGLEDTMTIAMTALAHRENLITENKRRAAEEIRRLAQEAGLGVTIEKRPRKRGRLPKTQN